MRTQFVIPVLVSILILGTLGLSQNVYAPSLNEVVKLTASDAAADDRFGSSVSVSGDTAIVGVIMGDSDTVSDSGAAYVFGRDVGGADNWGQVAKLTASDAAADDIFGFSVSISGDTAIVGAAQQDERGIQSGSAYVFVKPAGGWADSTQTAKLTASDAAIRDFFGFSVSILGDTVIVGAVPFFNDERSGSAYVFEKPGTGWSGSLNEDAKLTALDAAAGDLFGRSVSILGDTAVVGAIGDDSFKGSAYVFTRSGTTWMQHAKLTASDAATDDQFGFSVSISGDTAIVGARFDDTVAGSNSGSAYVFEFSASTGPPLTPGGGSGNSDPPADPGTPSETPGKGNPPDNPGPPENPGNDKGKSNPPADPGPPADKGKR